MALVLNTRLKSDGEVYEEGTPYTKLKKAEKELAKELDLLRDDRDDDEDDEEDEAEETEAEDTEDESE